MVVINSSELFQQKMKDLFQEFEFIHAYIDDIFILTIVDLTYPVRIVEEHHGAGGNLIRSLNNGSMMDYTTLVITV